MKFSRIVIVRLTLANFALCMVLRSPRILGRLLVAVVNTEPYALCRGSHRQLPADVLGIRERSERCNLLTSPGGPSKPQCGVDTIPPGGGRGSISKFPPPCPRDRRHARFFNTCKYIYLNFAMTIRKSIPLSNVRRA